MIASQPGTASAPPLDPRTFLRATPPFDALSPVDFETAADALEIAFHPRGKRLLTADGPASDALYLVRKGLVRLERGGETVQVLEEGDFFGFSILTGQVAFDVVVDEDLLAYRIPEVTFRRLLSNAEFARFFTLGLTERLRTTPALRTDHVLGGDVLVPVGDLVERPLVVAPAGSTVEEASRIMRDEGVSSVLLSTEPPAIVTDRDLRNRVLAAGRCPDIPAAQVASSPVHAVAHTTPVYGAWQAMLEHGIHHLAVERDGKIAGIVTATDLLRHQSHGPVLAFKKVERMRDRGGLGGYASDLARMISALVTSGLPATHVARLVAHLNDALTRRLLLWAERDLGPPPCPFAFVVFGSEGRYEQTLLTDQDNAIVYRDATPEAGTYFRALAGKVVADLRAAGFPACPDGFMATRLSGPLDEWTDRYDGWIRAPRETTLPPAAIFFDLRGVGGGLDLAPLTGVLSSARGNVPFLSRLARGAVASRPPIGAFRRLEVADGGVDLKTGGIAPIQALARVWALDAGVPVTSTVERLAAASEAGLVDGATAEGLVEAYVYLLGLRLREQLRLLGRKEAPSDRLPVDGLSPSDRRHLKEAFLAVRSAQKEAAGRYQVALP